MKGLIQNFKNLKEGVRRSLLVGMVPGAFILGSIVGNLVEYMMHVEDYFGYSIFAGLPIYWILVFTGIWIYEGFQKK